MPGQRFLKLEKALESLNSSDSDESGARIVVLPPDARELTDKDKGHENEVNTSEIIGNNVPWSLEVRTGDIVSSLNHTSSSVSTTKSGKKGKRHQSSWIKNKSP
ncbi:hypothetical protein TNCV_2594611 [Trichonephila clavipes]|nr:hypothetical protein TNCV_2594611 [Trichonephila clavipes]